MKHAVVTGCAGFVGSELSRQLIARSCRVTGMDNLSRGTKEHLQDLFSVPFFRFVEGDVRAPQDLADVFTEKPDCVFHLAARHFIPECVADPAGTYEINIVGAQRVWDAACKVKCERFLFVSTGDVYKPSKQPHREADVVGPFNAYGLSKLAAERALLMQAGNGASDVIIARLFNVYGPGETNPHLLPEILQQVRQGVRRIELGNLWPVRDFIFVRDVAQALIRLAKAPDSPGVVNVGTGGGWSVAEIVAMIAEAAGVPVEPVSVPEKCRPVERDVLRPDISRLVSLTRWRPRHDLLQGLRETLGRGS